MYDPDLVGLMRVYVQQLMYFTLASTQVPKWSINKDIIVILQARHYLYELRVESMTLVWFLETKQCIKDTDSQY